MTDTFNVTAAYDKTSYTQGDTIRAAISGGDVLTTTVAGQAGPLVIPVVAANGAVSSITLGSVPVTLTIATPESVVIDTSKPIVDTSPSPRSWVVSADKLSITATA